MYLSPCCLLPFPAASTRGGSPQWSASLIGAPWYWRERIKKKETKGEVERSFFLLHFSSAPNERFSSASETKNAFSLSAHFRDVLFHPVVVTVDAVAPDIGLLRDEDSGLLFVYERERERERRKGKRGKERSAAVKKEKRAERALPLSVPFPFSLSLFLLLSSAILTMRSNGIFQTEKRSKRRRRRRRRRQQLLCTSLKVKKKKRKHEEKKKVRGKVFFSFFVVAAIILTIYRRSLSLTLVFFHSFYSHYFYILSHAHDGALSLSLFLSLSPRLSGGS